MTTYSSPLTLSLSKGASRIRLAAAAWIAFAALAAPSIAGLPWEDAPVFSTEPARLLAAAQALPAHQDADVVVLLEEGKFLYDESRRCTQTYRLVYYVLTAAGAEQFSSLEAGWSPWHQEKPELRARVVTREGSVHELDPATVDDAPAAEFEPDVYSDNRVARAPLPAIAAGSVVEEEVVIRDKTPLFAAGVTEVFYFGKDVPTHAIRLIIESPKSLPLLHVTNVPGIVTERVESGENVRIVFTAGPLDAIDPPEEDMPSESARWPYVAFTNGSSWAGVARAYSDIVDTQIAAAKPVATVSANQTTSGDREAPRARIADILARLHREVRYTGVEFADASIVPRTPAETRRRRYGDCKDKAALLVSMLRAEGIPAWVALLRAGVEQDVSPELPGLGGFNHAIVYVAGNPPLWIDPTDHLARAGELPVPDQGRMALVASPNTTGLTRTPESQPPDNRLEETREFFLGETGAARAVETTQAWGGVERDYREFYGDSGDKDLEEWLQDYVRSVYVAEKLIRREHSDPLDLRSPFRVRLEMSEAARGTTTDNGAVVAIFPAGLLQRLPDVLIATDEDEDDEAGGNAATGNASAGSAAAGNTTDGNMAAGSAAGQRRSDFVFHQPFVTEWRYRIVPPPGFRPRPLPESGTVQLGTATFVKEFAIGKNNEVTARLHFDSGKRRLTAAEFTALRSAARELAEAPAILVTFDQIGQAYLAEDRIAEALSEFRRLSTLHPNEALHATQTAMALLDGGLGEAARQEIDRAIAIEPGSAKAHRLRGWILQHDLIGRFMKKGFDFAGAEASYRKAKELDPKDAKARLGLAILLEYDRDGDRYGAKSRLPEAIAEYRSLRADLDEKQYDRNLLFALVWAREFQDLEATARSLPPSETREQCLVLAAAATRGAAAALECAAATIPEAARRRQALEETAAILMRLRLYPEAAALFAEAAKGAGNPADLRARVEIAQRLRRHEDLNLNEGDPRTVVKKLSVALIGPEYSNPNRPNRLAPLLAAALRKRFDREGEAAWEVARRAVHAESSVGLPLDLVADLVLVRRFGLEGEDGHGYRVRLPTADGASIAYFVVREEGTYRVLGLGEAPAALASEARRLAAADNVAGARRWLDWARDEIPDRTMDDPLGGSPFARIWKTGAAAGTAEIHCAAASLMSQGATTDAEDAIPILTAARSAATSDSDRVNIDLALAAAYVRTERHDELQQVADRLIEAHPMSKVAFRYRSLALGNANRWDDIERMARARLATLPNDALALRALSETAVARNDYAGAAKLLQQLIDSGAAEANDYNSLAWLALYRPPVTEEALETARQAVAMIGMTGMTGGQRHGTLHTLAALYADSGKSSEARDIILKAIGASMSGEPESPDWYVLGRIAENYGVHAAARAAYERVERPKLDQGLPASTYLLAQRRLAALRRRK